jgi:HD-like signal output (HDOD) protein
MGPLPAMSQDKVGLVTARLGTLSKAGDVPAMSQTLRDIEELTRGENQNLRQLTRSVMKDLALTQRLLRLVNSSLYRPSGHDAVSTVSRALQMLGLDTVRSLALSLKLFERLGRGRKAERLSDEFTRSTFAAAASRLLLAPGTRLWEEAGLAALFHRLGQVLVINHLPDEARQLDARQIDRLPRLRQRELARELLGMSFEQLGHDVGMAWGLPEVLLQGLLRSDVRGPVPPCTSHEFTVRVAAGLAVELCEAIDSHGPGPSEALDTLLARYGPSLGLSGEAMLAVIDDGRRTTIEVARAMGIEITTTPFGRRLLGLAPPLGVGAASGSAVEAGDAIVADPDAEGASTPAGADGDDGGDTEGERVASAGHDDTRRHPERPGPIRESPSARVPPPDTEGTDKGDEITTPASAARALRELAACVADVAILLAEGASSARVIRRTLEGLQAALDSDRAWFASPDARETALFARAAVGRDSARDLAAARIALQAPADILAAAVARQADLMIPDATAPGIASRLPGWLRESALPGSLLLLPVRDAGRTLGVIYADREATGGFPIDELGMRLLRALRCQLAQTLREPASVG